MVPQKLVLPGGLRVLVNAMPHTRSASISIHIGAGSRHEPDRLSGAAHFIEHMIFKGSARYPSSRHVSLAVEGVGGMLNAATSYESTVYYAKVADVHLERAFDVLADMIIAPLFDPQELEKERRVIIEELHMTMDSPAELVHQLLDEALFGDQPIGRDIAGSEASVAALTREELLAFRARHYTRGAAVVSVAGNVDLDRVVNLATRALARMPEGGVLPSVPAMPARPGPGVRLVPRETEQANICLGFPALSWNDPDRRAWQVLDTVLGGDATSRLFQTIREEQGLAYSVGSYRQEYLDAGKWVLYAGVDPDQAHAALAAMLGELRALRADGITAEELARVKEQVKGSLLLGLEDTASVSSRNGMTELRYGRHVPVDEVLAEIEAVTRDDVQRVATRLLRGEGMQLAVVGPFEEGEQFMEVLDLDG